MNRHVVMLSSSAGDGAQHKGSSQEASIHLLPHLSFWEQCSQYSECALAERVGGKRSAFQTFHGFGL